MKTKLKVAGLYLLIGLFLAGAVICALNLRTNVGCLFGMVICLFGGIVACQGYHAEYLIEDTNEYQVVRKHDIVDTKETNIRFFVERKYIDLLMKEDIWRIASYKKDTQEEACEMIENIKKGIPVDQSNVKEVVTCKK